MPHSVRLGRGKGIPCYPLLPQNFHPRRVATGTTVQSFKASNRQYLWQESRTQVCVPGRKSTGKPGLDGAPNGSQRRFPEATPPALSGTRGVSYEVSAALRPLIPPHYRLGGTTGNALNTCSSWSRWGSRPRPVRPKSPQSLANPAPRLPWPFCLELCLQLTCFVPLAPFHWLVPIALIWEYVQVCQHTNECLDR